MNKLDLYWGLGASALVIMAVGWYLKLTIESAEIMDVIGFGAVMLVIGFLLGVAL